jgi:hypothetical protein
MKKVSISVSDLKTVVEALETGEITIADILALINKKDNQIKENTDEIALTVDYSCTVQEMINAGNYGWINNDITAKHFPLSTELNGKKVPVSTKLFHFNHTISSKDATSEMDKAGYRPATLAELLALGEAHPELQKEFPIVALGSIWLSAYDDRVVPVLSFDFSKRRLVLGWFGDGWNGNCRFLGVRK